MNSASVDEQAGKVVMDFRCWHSLLRTQTELAQLIRAIEDPQSAYPPDRDTDCSANRMAIGIRFNGQYDGEQHTNFTSGWSAP